MADELVFDRNADVTHEAAETVAPGIRRIVADNPGPFTFTGTATYLIGDDPVAIIDPGPADEAHLSAILAALGGRPVSHILITHTHRDHSPLAARLKALTGAPTAGAGPHRRARPAPGGDLVLDSAGDMDFVPDLTLADGATLGVGPFEIEAVATPGHTANHLAFALADRDLLFSGDHVMGWSTTVVAPPDGHMGDYMASLGKLAGRPERLYLPGHGGPIREARRYVRALAGHRRMREAQILERLAAGDRAITSIVAALYQGLDPRLTGAAGLSVLAHVEDLIERGLAVRLEGDGVAGLYARG